MDWIDFAKFLALAVGALAALVVVVVGSLAWFLNHPRD